jgi:hypothetical protein
MECKNALHDNELASTAETVDTLPVPTFLDAVADRHHPDVHLVDAWLQGRFIRHQRDLSLVYRLVVCTAQCMQSLGAWGVNILYFASARDLHTTSPTMQRLDRTYSK